MSSIFGLLSKISFLQDFVSLFIAGVNPFISHNLEKYITLKKVHYLSIIEDIEGDYLEFGVFTGSSFCHSIRCCKKLSKISSKRLKINFYGFDSFSGFGKLDPDDVHPFYTNVNFATNYKKVENRVKKVAKKINFKLVPGFFNETLKNHPSKFGIDKSRIIFIDCDTYSSANEALTFCIPTIQEGTFIVLDDFFAYRGNNQKGVKGAFSQFIEKNNIEVRHVFSYGMGGSVFVVSKKNF